MLKLYKDGRETLLSSSGQIGSHLPVYLRIEVRGNAPAAFGYSTDGHAWKQVENLPVGAEDLLQWDRVARPGLYYQGTDADDQPLSDVAAPFRKASPLRKHGSIPAGTFR